MSDSLTPESFRQQAEAAAVSWKGRTQTIPDEARASAPFIRDGGPQGHYKYCLPRKFAEHNLLPDIRDTALALFSVEQIHWHAAIDEGPSNHLLDSQVQCVNALAPGVHDPDFVKAAFGDVLSIAQVLPIEVERFLTFEFIGARDHLGEVLSGPRHRGSMTTSADAAIRYRTMEGHVEVALIEWKFTEDYRGKELKRPRGRPRADRYRVLWDNPQSPLCRNVVPYEDLFVEPFYQLARQQLLAWCMEREQELEATAVRVVHVCPSGNDGVHARSIDPAIDGQGWTRSTSGHASVASPTGSSA